MDNSSLIKYNSGLLKTVSNSISVTNKLLANKPQQLIPYRKGDKWVVLYTDKTLVIDCIYEAATPFINQLSEVKMNNKWGFMNPETEIVIPCIYDEVRPFWNDEHNLPKVSLNGKWGIINKTGKNVIPIEYDFVNSMSEAFVRKSIYIYICINQSVPTSVFRYCVL